MKKAKTVILLTAIMVIFSLFVPGIIENMLPSAKVTQLREVDYVGYVTASGEVVQKNKQQIKTDCPIIVSEVNVAPGDTVRMGQSILKVDREKTAKKLAEAADYSSLAGLTTGVFATSYEDAMNKIPSEIISNVSGVIESVFAVEGGYISQGEAVAAFIGAGDLIITAQVPENKVSKILVGQPVEITGSGFEGSKYYGYVRSIGLTAKKVYVGANQETVVDVEISIDNLDEKIKAGYSTKCRIITEQKNNINIVPYESVMQDNDGKEYVYVFSSGLAIRKDIETGVEINEGVEVLSGLSGEEAVISTPYDVKESGTLVKIVE
ncbi:MAG: HlyD family efflux transporter periplasmic adaptor subunit [Oscillospiraceae bacterium]|jgi:multidrug efflux pump subunit AcrA (membrane-fusion protein)